MQDAGRMVRMAVMLMSVAAGGVAAKPITTESLLDDMTNLRGMAEFPEPAYTCKQFSSYDRASKSPAEDWFANADCGQYLRIEERDGRKEHVMMDAAGPGAIVRIWSANPAGTLRIYLDGSETPVIETPLKQWLGGDYPGVPRPIAGERSKGWNSHLPIPYAKHCKVTSDEGNFYYHVNYRTYPEGTEVVSFAAKQIQALAGPIAEVAKRLASPRQGGGLPADRARQEFSVTLDAGGSKVIAELTGPRAICGFLANVGAPERAQAMRGVVVEMVFDGEKTVEAPIGDFFGSAPDVNPYASLPLGMTENGELWSHWYMPFKSTAKVMLRNLGKQETRIRGGVSSVPCEWTDRTMHFHAGWRSAFDVATRPMQDWNYLTAKGQGVFAGVAFAIANPSRAWWGEGDEKIYVDGETFPSHFGTGTEDYYGYAWCHNEVFVHAYHNQSRCDGPGNYGHTSVNRWHILDRIPFTRDFRFDMELWHWDADCKVDMSVTAYWYARPGGTATFAAIQPADIAIEVMPAYTPVRVEGAIEGEEMTVVKKVGPADPQDVNGCSNDQHLWWRPQKDGAELTLRFNVAEAGTYRVLGRFVTARDYGIVQLAINSKKAGEPIDLYSPNVVVRDEADLGTFELKAGGNELKVKTVGANEKADKAYMFGLDYLRLEPAK